MSYKVMIEQSELTKYGFIYNEQANWYQKSLYAYTIDMGFLWKEMFLIVGENGIVEKFLVTSAHRKFVCDTKKKHIWKRDIKDLLEQKVIVKGK